MSSTLGTGGSGWTDRLVSALRVQGVRVVDLRGALATHETRRYKTRPGEGLRGLVVHQAQSRSYGQQAVEAIARYHVSPKSHLAEGGAPGFAYTLALDADGTVYVAWDVEVKTWSHGGGSVEDANSALLGLCCLGDYAAPGHAGGAPPPTQERALQRVWTACASVWGWEARTAPGAALGGILTHADLGKPACPGSRLALVVGALRWGRGLPPSGPSEAHPWTTQVYWRQAWLSAVAAVPGSIVVDGVWGLRSRGALAGWQAAHGLPADGIWSDDVERLIREETGTLDPVEATPDPAHAEAP